VAFRSVLLAAGALIGVAGLISGFNLLAKTEIWHAQAWGKLIGIALVTLLGVLLTLRGIKKPAQ